jgi:hypothetical protein
MVEHDSLDIAPLNDGPLSKQQKLYGGSRFTLLKVYLSIMSLSIEVAR